MARCFRCGASRIAIRLQGRNQLPVRIAIVSQHNSPGGGARFLRGLCLGLLGHAEVTEVGLFIDAAGAQRDEFLSLLPSSERLGIRLMNSRGDFWDDAEPLPESVQSPRRTSSPLREWALRRPGIVKAYRRFRGLPLDEVDVVETALSRIALANRVVDAISGFDVAYFPWPRLVVPPPEPRALVATFHDFNHRHHFGNFRPCDIELLDEEMVEWLSGRVQPVASTPFIANELNNYYPMRTHEPEVIYLSTFAIHDPSSSEVAAVTSSFGLSEGFVLCPTNIGPHKNVLSLLRAAGQMKRDGVTMPLVLTGSGTQCLGVDPSDDPLYQSIFKQAIDDLNAAIVDENLIVGEDIWSLGYVTDIQMDALVRGARLVVAPSRYEAGSGPALDAWWLGTPVASSALPPVVEQIEFLGTEAALFEPTDVDQMAAVLTKLLGDPERQSAMAECSREAIGRYSWNEVATGYLRVFREAIARECGPSGSQATQTEDANVERAQF